MPALLAVRVYGCAARRNLGALATPLGRHLTSGHTVGNRQLRADELERANVLLHEIRAKLEQLGLGDKELLFAYRRKIHKELTYDERSKPMARRKLKDQKWKEQRGLCAICGNDLPEKYTVLDRVNAVDGYTAENTRLIHQECDVQHQASRGYA